MTSRFHIISLAVGFTLCGVAANAQTAYEPFNYATTSDLPNGNATGFEGWTYATGGVSIGSNLSYNSLSTSGNALSLGGGGTQSIQSTTSFSGGSTFYSSFLMQVNTPYSGNYGGFVFGGIFQGLGDTDGSGNWNVGITVDGADLGAGAATHTPIGINQTFLYVTEYNVTPNGGNYSVTATSWMGLMNGANQTLTSLGSVVN